ncbi:MAG: hypothetical protein HZC55_19110 [Verrucomicrobia bacterium]|nr:hypothetical protein [Verrucomicrobiota bacterium]
MKSLFSLGLILAAALAASRNPVGAAVATGSALSHPVGAVERSSSVTIVRGTPLVDVSRALGEPAVKLDNDVWVYRGFHGGAEQSRHDNCDTLMVTFVDGRVSDLRLVNNRALVILAQRMDPKKNPDLLAVAGK